MKILLVDDEPLQLLRLKKAAEGAFSIDEEFFSFGNPFEALEMAKTIRFDLAFLDIEMPGLNGIQLAKKLKAIHPLTSIIFVTAYDNYALEAFRVHASGYLSKPVSKGKIEEELRNLHHLPMLPEQKKLQIKCFGDFEVFAKGEPLRFAYKKSKEAFAYLVDREGSAISVSLLNTILWEEDHPSYLRNIIADIQLTLKKAGAEDVFYKRHGECFIDVNQVDCDAYEFHKGNPDAIRMYRGEYMNQYDWAFFKAN